MDEKNSTGHSNIPETSSSKDHITKPVDADRVRDDIDRKLKLFGIVHALRNGRLPDNAQIDTFLAYLSKNVLVKGNGLSAEGRRLINDTRLLVETSRYILKEKNRHDLLQHFIYHAVSVGRDSDLDSGPETLVHREELVEDTRKALKHLRSLLKLFLTNSGSRKLLYDFSIIGREVFGTVAMSMAERVRPSKDALESLDNPSGFGSHTPSPAGIGDDSILSTQASEFLPYTVIGPVKESPDSSATSLSLADEDWESARDMSDSEADSDSDGEIKPQEPLSFTNETAASRTSLTPVEAGKKVTRDLKKKLGQLSTNMKGKYRRRVRDELRAATDHIMHEFPKQRRAQFLWRLKKVVVECQSDPAYKSSLSWLLTQLEGYFSHTKDVATSGAHHATSLFSTDPLLHQALAELRQLSERLANHTSLDRVLNAIKRLWEDSINDEDLRAWWHRVDLFVRKSLLEPGYILSPDCNRQLDKLRLDSRRFFNVKYKAHKDEFIESIQAWLQGWQDDPLNKKFLGCWTKLMKDLLMDEEGKLTYKSNLWQDVRNVILPAIAETIGNVPIPRIEHTGRDLDLVLENLVLQSRKLIPNFIEIKVESHIKITPNSKTPNTDLNEHSFVINMSHIQADMKEVAYYYKRKTGFPRLTDQGTADVVIGGRGITINIELTSTTNDRKDRTHVFKVRKVDVDIASLKFQVRESQHKLLYKTFKPIATKLLKKKLSQALAEWIETALQWTDAQILDVRERAKAASTSMMEPSSWGSRTQIMKDFLGEEGRPQSSNRAPSLSSRFAGRSGSAFHIFPNIYTMLLPDKGSEKGWIRKQMEQQRLALKGRGWRSPAFSMDPTSSNVGTGAAVR